MADDNVYGYNPTTGVDDQSVRRYFLYFFFDKYGLFFIIHHKIRNIFLHVITLIQIN